MGRQLNKLSARTVASLTKPGRHSDGGGLYLVVDKAGGRRWVFLHRWREPGQQVGAGRLREMGLGGLQTVSLAKARELATAARLALSEGKDPIQARRNAPGEVPTFGELADQLVLDLSPQWRNEKHRAQWSMTLTTYAASLRPLPVSLVETSHVLEVLKPIWQKRPETASRLRGRIEKVLDAAKAQGHRTTENPARWRGHLDHLLPVRQKLTRGHHAAMKFGELPAFLGQLRRREAVAARSLEFTILTAARTGEVIGARWDEIDITAKVWTVPADRMKAGVEHRVPLVARALEILDAVKPLDDGGFVFPGQRRGQPLSNMAMANLLKRMDVATVTVHGMRSAFRDWAGETTGFPREIVEAALAHTVGDAVERAYRRGDALKRRRELMDTWGRYLEGKAVSNVVALRKL